MEHVLNNYFYSALSGFNVAIAFVMFCYYMFNGYNWNKLTKFGWFVMASGLLAQSICIIDGITLDDQFFYQIWALKDIGIAIFTVGLMSDWVNPRR